MALASTSGWDSRLTLNPKPHGVAKLLEYAFGLSGSRLVALNPGPKDYVWNSA